MADITEWARSLADEAREYGVPEHTIGGLIDYIVNKIPPGGFLTAVLENRLMQAFGQADSMNAAALQEICAFLYNVAPSQCHGSPERADKWLAAAEFMDPTKAFNGGKPTGRANV